MDAVNDMTLDARAVTVSEVFLSLFQFLSVTCVNCDVVKPLYPLIRSLWDLADAIGLTASLVSLVATA